MMTYVLFHKNCNDGYGAAWSAFMKLGRTNVKYLAIGYQEEPPEMESASVVYLVDFSFKREQLLQLAERHEKVIILDHHKTAKEDLDGLLGTRNIEGVFDMNRSGAMITWDYFHQGKPAPRLIQHIQDRDLWLWKMEGTREVHEVLMITEYDGFDPWSDLATKLDGLRAGEVYDIGRSLIRAAERTIDIILNSSHVIDTKYGKCAIVNATSHWSEVGNDLLKKFPEAQYSASYYRLKDGMWKWSVRSQGDFDVSAIAKEFGGGGHKNAAGFKSDTLNWVNGYE